MAIMQELRQNQAERKIALEEYRRLKTRFEDQASTLRYILQNLQEELRTQNNT